MVWFCKVQTQTQRNNQRQEKYGVIRNKSLYIGFKSKDAVAAALYDVPAVAPWRGPIMEMGAGLVGGMLPLPSDPDCREGDAGDAPSILPLGGRFRRLFSSRPCI